MFLATYYVPSRLLMLLRSMLLMSLMSDRSSASVNIKDIKQELEDAIVATDAETLATQKEVQAMEAKALGPLIQI